MISRYILLSFRHLWKYKLQNLIGILGLACGLFCMGISICYFNLVSTVDHSFPHKDRLVSVLLERTPGAYNPEITKDPLFKESYDIQFLNEQFQSFEAFCRILPDQTDTYFMEKEGGYRYPYALNSIEADTNYSPLFSPVLLQGRTPIKGTPHFILDRYLCLLESDYRFDSFYKSIPDCRYESGGKN